jgi:hypothetical protein
MTLHTITRIKFVLQEVTTTEFHVLILPHTGFALPWKVACCQQFSEADFTFSECKRLNGMAVPTFCGTSSHSFSTQKQL